MLRAKDVQQGDTGHSLCLPILPCPTLATRSSLGVIVTPPPKLVNPGLALSLSPLLLFPEEELLAPPPRPQVGLGVLSSRSADGLTRVWAPLCPLAQSLVGIRWCPWVTG